ncbi:DUF1877 family protein [Streptacidiphilus sp. PAMC 29251]
MSYQLHLRAVPAAEIKPTNEWLEEFMLAAWSNRQEEYAAGIAYSIKKDFAAVNRLYTVAGSPSSLPIYGGDPVTCQINPPFLIMKPEQVRKASAFLDKVHFEALWGNVGGAISESWEDSTIARSAFLAHHEGLTAFYRAATQAQQSVVKAFW